MDVCGPMEVESLGGAKYVASIVDNKTEALRSKVT
jgi:3'-phosphoadenosine 5'-phosphosulfate sulfotransferase